MQDTERGKDHGEMVPFQYMILHNALLLCQVRAGIIIVVGSSVPLGLLLSLSQLD